MNRKPALKSILPVLTLAAASLGAWALIAHQPSLEQAPIHAPPPEVTVLLAKPQRLRLDVHSQGVVRPRTEIELVAEVTGKAVQLHPRFAAGGFFRPGEVLLTIDPRDYDMAIAQAQARIAEAERVLASEQAQAEQAQAEWQALGEGKPSPLALHEPQLAEARAKLKAALADLAKAKLQRSRCELRAPFAGRVRDKRVGLGQYVQAGEKLARIYSTDAAEIRLPLTAAQLGQIDLAAPPKVSLSAKLGGTIQHWQGRIVRLEAAVDEATGLFHAIAEVANPYAGRQPLLAGLFVQADIEGSEQDGLVVLPSRVVNAAQEVWLVDQDQRLRLRPLEVLREEAGRIVVKAGLQTGERLLGGGVQVPVEGMKVSIAKTEDSL